MPSSNAQQIPSIVRIIRELNPRSVLDVGAGYGKYGFLIREYLDRFKGEVQIDAIEPQGRQPQHSAVYDNFYTNDFLSQHYMRYDLVLMIDVLEHFTKPTGWSALDKAVAMSKHVLVATPANPAPQEGQWEEHLSQWTVRELKDHYKAVNRSDRPETIICVISGQIGDSDHGDE